MHGNQIYRVNKSSQNTIKTAIQPYLTLDYLLLPRM